MRRPKRVLVIACLTFVSLTIVLWKKQAETAAEDKLQKRVKDQAHWAEHEQENDAKEATSTITACNLKNLLLGSFTMSDLRYFQENCDVIQYNRCMKSGSTTFARVIYELSQVNNISTLTRPGTNRYFSREKQLFDALDYTNSSHPRPLYIAMHRFFLPYHDLNVDQPFLINVVRHPIGRTISHYYFQTFSFPHIAERKIQDGIIPRGTLEDCARGVNPLAMCNVFFGYFCEDKECSKRDENALAKTMKNIEEYGMIIGITEELYGFAELLERLYPRLFKGACAMYNNTVDKLLKYSSNSKVQALFPPPQNIVEKLPNLLRTEIELYEFIKQRYHAIRTKVFSL